MDTKEAGAIGGSRSRINLPPEERTRLAKKAARAMHRKRKRRLALNNQSK